MKKKFILKTSDNFDLDELKQSLNKLNKDDLCYILDINKECCFDKEKTLKNIVINDIQGISFNTRLLIKLSKDELNILFRSLVILSQLPKNILDKILSMNFSLNNLKFLIRDFDEKYELLNNLDHDCLIFILVSKNISEIKKDDMIAIILSKFSLDELNDAVYKFSQCDKYSVLEDMENEILDGILLSNNLPPYNNRQYKVACICYNVSLDELENILSEIDDKSNFLEELSDSQLFHILYCYNKNVQDNREMNIRNIFRLNLSLSQLKELINDYEDKFYLLKKYDEKFLMFILVSKNLEENNNIDKMIGIITANFSFEELRSIIGKINAIDFYSFSFLKEYDEDILYAVLCINGISPYRNRDFNIAAICFNLIPEDIKRTINEIPKKEKLLDNLSVKSINHITFENNLPYVGSKNDKIKEICYHFSLEDIESIVNDSKIKKIERQMEIENQNRMRTTGSVGVSFSKIDKFFR